MNRRRNILGALVVLAGLGLGNLIPVHNEPPVQAKDTISEERKQWALDYVNHIGPPTTGLDSELGGSVEAHPAGPLAGLPADCGGSPNPWRFMFAGDSQTTGTGNQRPYWAWLMDRMASVPRVSVGSQTSVWGTHEGIGGQRPSGLLARWNGLLNNYHPNVLVLDIGTNTDRDAQDWPDGPTTLNNVRALVQQALDFDHCMRIIIAKPSLRYDNFESIAQQWFNDRVPSLAESFDTTGSQVRWVDFSWLPKTQTIDGLHPTATGADGMSWYTWDQVQHFVGWGSPGSPGDGHLAYSAPPFAVVPSITGTSIKR